MPELDARALLTEAWVDVTRQPTVEAMLARATERARTLVGAGQAVTSLTIDAEGLQGVSGISLSDRYGRWRAYDVPPDGSGIYAEVARTNRPMRMSQAELEAHPLWRGFGSAKDHPPMRGWLAVPLVALDGSNLGIMQVTDKEDGGDFSADDQDLLTEFARLLALVVERAHAEERAAYEATHDALTGLPNRAALRAVAATTSSEAVLLLDVDGFRDVNDALGHAVGDDLLRRLSDRLSETVADRGTLVRLGGDEFAVLVPDPDRQELTTLGDELLGAVRRPFDLSGLDVAVDGSVGVAVGPQDGADTDALLRSADLAMYRAKRRGGGCTFFDPVLDLSQQQRLTLVTDLRAATSAGSFVLHYQPVVDLVTGEVRSVEALVRWPHPYRGLIPPCEFVELAEQTGLIVPLTEWVVAEAARATRAWVAAGLDVRCAVNLSPLALGAEQVADRLLPHLAAHRDVLTVEVTESALVSEQARRTLVRLVEAGLTCAIDDFGTGYASLAALKTFPVSTLKIDRELVQDLDESDDDVAIIRAVVDLARARELTVIAEGVETPQAADRLRNAGVGLAQGFHFGPPMPAEELLPWLDARAEAGDAAR